MASDVIDDELRAFVEVPAGYATPERLSECLGGEISQTGCRLLLSSQRLHRRLSRHLSDHYSLPNTGDKAISLEDRSIALLAGDKLDELALRSGAVFWAGSIAAAIGKDEAVALQNHLGDEIITSALRHRDLSATPRPVGHPDTILDRVMEDGWKCFDAWLADTPPSIGMRVRLKLPETRPGQEGPEQDHVQLGARIVRRAVGDIDQ